MIIINVCACKNILLNLIKVHKKTLFVKNVMPPVLPVKDLIYKLTALLVIL